MKIRKGFVSNSSSCSFLIYGACLTDTQYKKWYLSNIETFLTEVGRGEYDPVYLGLSLENIGDDETKNQFETKIEAELERIFPNEKLSLGTFEDGWFNG